MRWERLNRINWHLNLFIVFILVLCVCTGQDGEKSLTITLNVPANANLIKSLQKKTEEFKSTSGISIKLIPFSGQEKLYAMIAAGKPPDIFYTNTVVRDRLAAEGHLIDLLTVCGKDSLVKRIRPNFIRRGTSIDGGWYQFCDWTFTYGVYFNKTLFDRANLPYPDEKWTWEAMLQLALKLTTHSNTTRSDQYGIFIARHFISALERMNGADYSPNALFLEFPEEALEVQQDYLDLIYKHRVMPEINYVQAQGMQISQMLNTGRVAMIIEAVPNLDFINSLTIDWDMAPLPRFGKKMPAYFRSASGGLSLSSACANPQAAWQVIKWLVTQSEYNTPNPIFKDVDFVSKYIEKYPMLRDKNFAVVWRLSEQYDGGDTRDFVRYSSWTTNTILTQLNPKLDLFYAGKLSLRELTDFAADINMNVRNELKQILTNDNIQQAFKDGIQIELQKSKISLNNESF